MWPEVLIASFASDVKNHPANLVYPVCSSFMDRIHRIEEDLSPARLIQQPGSARKTPKPQRKIVRFLDS